MAKVTKKMLKGWLDETAGEIKMSDLPQDWQCVLGLFVRQGQLLLICDDLIPKLEKIAEVKFSKEQKKKMGITLRKAFELWEKQWKG